MAYLGQTYTFLAGSTSHVYTYWLFNGGAGSGLQFSDILPSLGPDDCVFFLNKNGVAFDATNTQVMDGSLIVPGSILTGAIAAGAITTNLISAGAITADRIAGGAVTADKLTVGGLGNQAVLNPGFEDLDNATPQFPAQWLNVAGAAQVTSTSATGSACLGLTTSGTVPTAAAETRAGSYLPVAAGDQWYLTCQAWASAVIASGFTVTVTWYNAAGATVGTASTPINNVGLGTSAALIQPGATLLVPAGATQCKIRFSNSAASGTTIYVDDVTFQRLVVSARISDGAITASKLAAGAITAQDITSSTFETAASGARVAIGNTGAYTGGGGGAGSWGYLPGSSPSGSIGVFTGSEDPNHPMLITGTAVHQVVTNNLLQLWGFINGPSANSSTATTSFPQIGLSSPTTSPFTGKGNIYLNADSVYVRGALLDSSNLSTPGGYAVYARDDLVVATFSGTATTISGNAGAMQVNFPAAMSGTPAVIPVMISGASQWVVASRSNTGFVIRTWGSTGVATPAGGALSGMYIAALA